MDLSGINSIAILIIIIVVFINFLTSIYSYRQTRDNRAEIIKLNNNIADYIDYLEGAIRDYVKKSLEYQTQNILDLDEFNDLDPEIKELYKKHIINNLMPAILATVNSMYYKNKSQISDEEISAAIKDMISNLKSQNIDSMSQSSSPQPIQVNRQEPIKILTTNSGIECSNACKTTTGCKGSMYDGLTKKCTLYK